MLLKILFIQYHIKLYRERLFTFVFFTDFYY